jgi:WD40 repeat protein
VWDSAGHPLSPPFGNDFVLFDASFSPDGQSVLSAGWDTTARLWEAATGRQITKLDHPAGLFRARFSPDGRRIATASYDHGARVWDAATGKLMPSVLPGGTRVAFSSNGRWLATTGLNGVVRVWDLSTRDSVIQTFAHDEVIIAEFSPDERYVVTASTGPEHTARVYDASTGELITPPMKHAAILRQAAFSPDNRILLTVSENAARLREVATGKDVCPLMQHAEAVRHAAFNPEGTRVVTACDDGAARIWDAATGRLAMPPLAHSNAVVRAEFSSDGKLIVTASLDQTARLWNAFTGQPASPPLLHPLSVYIAAFSPDGRRLVTVCRSRFGIDRERTRSFAQVWDVTTGQRQGVPLRHDHLVYHADFSPDGQRIVTGGFDGTARVWDAQTGQQLASSFRYGRDVKQSRFSPDGRRVATGTAEGVVQIWDATTGEAITPQLEHPSLHDLMHLRFSADGQRLLVASGAQTASLRRLPKTDLPVEDLLLQAQLLSGYKIEAAAGMVPLPPMELSNAWHTLRTKYPTMFSQEQPRGAVTNGAVAVEARP